MSGNDNTSETTRTSAVTTTMTNNDLDLLVLGAAGPVVVNLPAVAGIQPGRPYSVLKDAAAQTVTITPAAGTINGAATLVLASGAFHGAVLVTDGSNWFAKALY